uniref:Peptidase S1 domain-containing protein n=1 Tax=Anopheles coluzzii TaxID=1518534 RepID=A0A6E8WDD0_ANOCL
MALVGWTRASGKIDYLCGGSLIGEQFILTAAHCKQDESGLRPDTVRLGTHDARYAQQIAIRDIIVHPSYDDYTKYFDVALIELGQNAWISPAVCPACLWQEDESPSGPMEAIAFGVTNLIDDPSPTLQRIVLSYRLKEECEKVLTINKTRIHQGVRADQFCVAGKDMATCASDSGSPVDVNRVDISGSMISLITGVVSFGTTCVPGLVGVYTKVSEYVEWIEQMTQTSMSYRACTKEIKCFRKPGEPSNMNINLFKTNSRFGLLWDELEGSPNECGATLIDYQYLLTTASCVTTSKGHPKFVISTRGERVAISNVYVSHNYSSPTNDIALLKIDKYANHNVYPPVCLWDHQSDGEYQFSPEFSAYGLEEPIGESSESLFVTDRTGSGCEEELVSGTDLQCFHNEVPLMPGVCWMDHGGPVIGRTYSSKTVHMYGVVSPLSRSCGSNLFMVDVTPHIPWIEAIVFGK